MTIRQRIEGLLGGPIELKKPVGKIPCIETSDSQRLCKRPLVSVHMVTYNHEPYIREAIEGVVMQETNFEYELVIGEDSSTDATRQICFELQQKHPDKIRVLWSEENLYKNWGNYQRVYDHCRGEYIAYCEGDDYWTDRHKLQKQIDLMRANNAGFCVAFHSVKQSDGQFIPSTFDCDKRVLMASDVVCHWFHTTTYVVARKVWERLQVKYSNIYPWYDVVLANCAASETKTILLPEVVSVYRLTGAGICTSLSEINRIKLMLRQEAMMYFDGPVVLRSRMLKGMMVKCMAFFARGDRSQMASFRSENRWRITMLFLALAFCAPWDVESIKTWLKYLKYFIRI